PVWPSPCPATPGCPASRRCGTGPWPARTSSPPRPGTTPSRGGRARRPTSRPGRARRGSGRGTRRTGPGGTPPAAPPPRGPCPSGPAAPVPRCRDGRGRRRRRSVPPGTAWSPPPRALARGAQPPGAGAEVVLKYLARYTYRVAISNGRLLSVSDEGVTFSYKDYRHGGRQRRMTLSLEEVAGRFLQHVLPRGLVRVRHYGLVANRGGEGELRACRRLLLAEAARVRQAAADGEGPPRLCPVCGEGQMRPVETIGRRPKAGPQEGDSS